MALIVCPECSRQISDTATSCPNCGLLLQPLLREKHTEISPLSKNRKLGILLIIPGTLLIPAALLIFFIPFIGIFFGIFGLFVSFTLIAAGFNQYKGVHKVNCPYCNTPLLLPPNSENLKCRTCKKISVRKDNLLKTVL